MGIERGAGADPLRQIRASVHIGLGEPWSVDKDEIFIARRSESSLKGGVLWSKDKLKASKGCCQSR